MSVPNMPPADTLEGAAPAGRGYWFTPVPVYLLEGVYDPASPVNAPAVILWAHIHRHYAWRERVFPSYARLAEETGQSESAVKRQLNTLKAAGAITWGAAYRSRGRSSNEYALAPTEPFRFDRETARPVRVKSDRHPSVEVKNELAVEFKSDPHPQAKSGLGIESSSYLESTEDLSLPPSSEPTAVPAAPVGERENLATPDHKPTTTSPAGPVVQVPAQRGEQRQQQRQDAPRPGDAATRPVAAAQTAPQPAGVSQAARRIVDAYTAALGRPLLSGTRTNLHQQATEALTAGYPETWLADRARELADRGWTDLAKHVEKSTAPLPGTTPPATTSSGRPPWCGECGGGMAHAAASNTRWRTVDGRVDGEPCPRCHPAAVKTATA